MESTTSLRGKLVMDGFLAGGKFLTATLPPAFLSVHSQLKLYCIFTSLFTFNIVQHCHQKHTQLWLLVPFHVSTKLFTWVKKHSLINDAPWTWQYSDCLWLCFRLLLLWLYKRLDSDTDGSPGNKRSGRHRPQGYFVFSGREIKQWK